MELLDSILQRKVKFVSIAGMAKNTGKTATLNYLIKLAELRNIKVALSTIGLDGEDTDKIMLNKKPNILIVEDTIVANAKSLIKKSDLNFEILTVTDISSPLGEIVIAKSRDTGFVQLSGPSSKCGLKNLKNEIQRFTSDLILIDGALDRKSFCSSIITDATILAVGAVLGDSIEKIVNKVLFQVELFNLAEIEDCRIKKIVDKLMSVTKALIIDQNYHIEKIKIKTTLNNTDKILDKISKDTKAVVLNGAVVDGVLEAFMAKIARLSDIDIIVYDATHLFISPMLFRRFKYKGGKLKVIKKINILGVTVNPSSPNGSYLDPIKLLKEVGKSIYPIPCYEIILGKKFTEKGVENLAIFK